MVRRGPKASFIEQLDSLHVDAGEFAIIQATSEFREKLLELIKSAERRIYITALYLQDDAAGQQVLQAIYEAKQAKPELDVKIFVDFLRAQRGLIGHEESIGNVRLYREFDAKYEHKIEILGVPVKSKEVLGVLHLKGFIFDDTLLYSGASLNNVYLHHGEKYRCDRYHLIKDQALCNSMVKFLQQALAKSNAVKSLTAENIPPVKKLKQAIQGMKKHLRISEYRYRGHAGVASGNKVSMTPLLGFGGRKNQLNTCIIEMVKDTDEALTIYTPYFNFPNPLNNAVRRLLKKGRKVEIIIGDKTANDFFIPVDQEFSKIGIIPYLYETNLRKFVKKNQNAIDAGLLNVHLWRDGCNSFHLKGLSCDGKMHLITGHNFNPRACKLDLENGILIQDPKQLLAEAFASERDAIIKNTHRLTHFTELEEIKDYPEAAKKLMRSVKRAKLDSVLKRLL